jgi:hypothetical protein
MFVLGFYRVQTINGTVWIWEDWRRVVSEHAYGIGEFRFGRVRHPDQNFSDFGRKTIRHPIPMSKSEFTYCKTSDVFGAVDRTGDSQRSSAVASAPLPLQELYHSFCLSLPDAMMITPKSL